VTSLTTTGLILVALPAAFFTYAYILYPAILWLLTRKPAWEPPPDSPTEWPFITIVLPVHNEERVIRQTVESLLAIDYPSDRRQILILSDASTDATHDIVREYAAAGVELVALPERRGKTAAENESARHATGAVIINTDATTRILPNSVKPLIAVFQDPTVGVASGRDVSAAVVGAAEASRAESGYVGYEMWVRDLETRFGSIVGASGCFMAIRRSLFDQLFPEALSRDFASPLLARAAGYRAVSVPTATAIVPRARALQAEYRRKTRTMARGLETLWFLRGLLNPLRFGRFAWMLWSHKAARWLGFLATPLGFVGLALLTIYHPVAAVVLSLALVGVGLGTAAFLWPANRTIPKLVASAGYLVGSTAAAISAWGKALKGERNPIWEPTRR
jgi:cellulose synthase/poly-beta-1,6-N-acetylglucosamine synthase-like glycosyltransferase